MDPKYLIVKLSQASKLKAKPMAILFEALRTQIESEGISAELRDAYLAAFYRGFPTEQFHPQSIMGFYAPYAMRAFLATSQFRLREIELGQTLYKFCATLPVEEVADIHVFWGVMHGRPALVRETLTETRSKVEGSQDAAYYANRLKALTSIAKEEAIDGESLKGLVSTQETKWNGLPWMKWQFDNILKFS